MEISRRSIVAVPAVAFILMLLSQRAGADLCYPHTCQELKDSATATLDVSGDVVTGTETHKEIGWGTGCVQPGCSGAQSCYLQFAPVLPSGQLGAQWTPVESVSYEVGKTVCEDFGEICNVRKVFRGTIGPHFFYHYSWVATCDCSPTEYERAYVYRAPPWDPDVCQTCSGGTSNGVCAHPTPDSLVVSAKPEITLKSPYGDLPISRTYRSSMVNSNLFEDPVVRDGIFGKGWRSSVEYRLAHVKSGATTYGLMLYNGEAERKFFLRRPGDWALEEKYDYVGGGKGYIEKGADGKYTWRDEAGTKYLFSSEGLIEKITDAYDREINYGYVGGKLTTVTDKLGRVVTFDYLGGDKVREIRMGNTPYAVFTYDNGYATQVDFAGKTIKYYYERTVGSNRLLTKATYVTSAEPPEAPFLHATYDDQGKLEVVSEGPEGKTQRFVWTSDTQTTVTEWADLNGNLVYDGGDGAPVERTYTIQDIMGARVVVASSGAGCSDCTKSTTYDVRFNPLKRTDKQGNERLMQYNPYGDIASLTEIYKANDTDDQGAPKEQRVTTYEYQYVPESVPPRIQSRTAWTASVAKPGAFKESKDEYNVKGKLLKHRESGHLNGTTSFTYETTYEYTTDGAIDWINGPMPGTGDVTDYTYNPCTSAEHTSDGHTCALPTGLLSQVVGPDGAITVFNSYDDLGNVLTKTDANGNVTSFTYDTRGLMLTQTTTSGTRSYETKYEYDALGNMTKTQNFLTISGTDPQGNITRTTNPGKLTTFTYGSSGLRTIQDEFENRIEYTYVGGDKIKEEIFDAQNNRTSVVEYEYDGEHRLKKTKRPSTVSGAFHFDTLHYYDENGGTQYEGNGNLQYKKHYYGPSDSGNPTRVVTQVSDGLGRLKSVSVDSNPVHTLSYQYDAQGNLRSVTDADGGVTTYTHDDLGRVVSILSPETGLTQFEHNAAGSLVKKTDALDRVTDHVYDDANRLTGITYSDGTPAVVRRYDTYTGGVSFANAVGRLTETEVDDVLRRFRYDHTGRLLAEFLFIDGLTFETSYTYNVDGQLATITYPGGRRIRYAYYTASDQIEKVWMRAPGEETETTLAQGIGKEPFGPLALLTYGNGLSLSKSYYPDTYTLATLAVGTPQGSVFGRLYGYDEDGNIGQIDRAVPGGVESHVYTYDGMDRLETWNAPGRAQGFNYTANGNRLTKTDGQASTQYSYVPGAPNLLASASGVEDAIYGHDGMGNITGWNGTVFEYDARGRMKGAKVGATDLGLYRYNTEGQRVKKVAGDKVCYYIYDMGGRLLHEYQNGGTYTADYVYLDGEPLAMIATDGVPLITAGPTATQDSATTVTIGWTTDGLSDSRVKYGLTSAYGSEVTAAELVTRHAVVLANLVPGENYHFQVVSRDKFGNQVSSGDMVFHVNAAPVANNKAVSTNEDTSKVITLTGSDPENSPLTYSIVTGPAHGTLTGSGATRTYTPAANYYGSDSFTFRVSDGILCSNTATVSITVTQVIDSPIIIDNTDGQAPNWCEKIGTWNFSDFFPEAYGTEHNYLTRPPSQGGDERVIFHAAVRDPGYYNVWLWWPNTGGNTTISTRTPWSLQNSNEPFAALGVSNQRVGGGKWNSLGRFFFNGSTGEITIFDSAADGKKVLADAVKLVWDTNQSDPTPQGAAGSPPGGASGIPAGEVPKAVSPVQIEAR